MAIVSKQKTKMKKAATSVGVEPSSGNVFEDLGLSDPQERLAKAQLAASNLSNHRRTRTDPGESRRNHGARPAQDFRPETRQAQGLFGGSAASLLERSGSGNRNHHPAWVERHRSSRRCSSGDLRLTVADTRPQTFRSDRLRFALLPAAPPSKLFRSNLPRDVRSLPYVPPDTFGLRIDIMMKCRPSLDASRSSPGWRFRFGPASAQKTDPAGVEFFEKKIRPVLVEHCYKCHSAEAKKAKGGLRLDSRANLLKGGDSGPGRRARQAGREPAHQGAAPRRRAEDAAQGQAARRTSSPTSRSGSTMGAPDPRDGKPPRRPSGIDWTKARKFWSFQPPRKCRACRRCKNAGWAEDADRSLHPRQARSREAAARSPPAEARR